jgi:hypothetical protein
MFTASFTSRISYLRYLVANFPLSIMYANEYWSLIPLGIPALVRGPSRLYPKVWKLSNLTVNFIPAYSLYCCDLFLCFCFCRYAFTYGRPVYWYTWYAELVVRLIVFFSLFS